VVEWLMALVLKTSEVKASAGSNPALSVPMTSAEPSQGLGFLVPSRKPA
jgi:hypothetical protein